MKSMIVHQKNIAKQPLDDKISRRVLAYLPEEMVVEVSFQTGGVGAPHSHPHVQCTYVASGEFVFTIEGQPFTVKAGDTLAFASGETHGCVCVSEGVLIDVFSPMRDDFLPKAE